MMGNVAGVSQLLETAGTPVLAIPSGTAAPHTEDFAAAMQQANSDAGHPSAPLATASPSEAASPAETSEEPAGTSPSTSISPSATKQSATSGATAAISVPAHSVTPNANRFSNANMLTAALARSTSTFNLASLSTPATTPGTISSPALTAALQANPLQTATNSSLASSQSAANVAAAASAVAPSASGSVQPSSTLIVTKPVTGSPALSLSPNSAGSSARSNHLIGKPVETAQTLATTPTTIAASTPEQPVLTVSAVPVLPIAVATPTVQPPQSALPVSLAPSSGTLGLQAPAALHGTALSSTPTLPLNATVSADATPQPLSTTPASSNQFAQTIATETVVLHGTAKAAAVPVPSLPVSQTPLTTPVVSAETAAKAALNSALVQSSSQPQQPAAANAQTALPSAAVEAVANNPNILIASAAPATQPVIASAAPAKSVLRSGAASPLASTSNPQPLTTTTLATTPTVAGSTAAPLLPGAPHTAAAALSTAPATSVHKSPTRPVALDAQTSAPVPLQPSASIPASTPSTLQADGKSHTAALQPPTAALSSPLPDGATLATLPSTNVQAPIAFAALSTPASIGSGLAQSATAGVASATMPSETLPHSTLSSSPTTLEVGVSSGTHGWLKIRAELNASGTVDASLTGTSSTAATRLQSDLPALNSFLQNEKVSVGALTVTAPSATAGTLHATAASTLDSTAAFTRAATEATTGSSLGANVNADASANGGRAPQQNPQGNAHQAPMPVELREGRETSDLPIGPAALPGSYADLTGLGGRTASSAEYAAGGSWLNVRA